MRSQMLGSTFARNNLVVEEIGGEKHAWFGLRLGIQYWNFGATEFDGGLEN